VEASALPAPAAVARTRTSIGGPLLRLRSDEQLVALFRAGHDDAFRVIHDRYRQRLFAYTRQMLPRRQDAEDALQDIFVRAYAGLRANDRELALRAWLYRVAHNCCIDELRRPPPPAPEVIELLRSPAHDPIAEADRRESLRRLIADVRRLPDQQRSALLMRELGGMSYADVSAALGVTIPAVKSLLVRARMALAQALEARDTSCSEIREELTLAHDRGRRPNSMARRHMRDCAGCQEFRHAMRGISRRFAAIVPTLGPLGVLANLLGAGGTGGSAAAGSGAVAAGGAAGGGSALVSVGALGGGAGHVATLLAAAVVTAGGAVEIQHTIAPAVSRHHQHQARTVVRVGRPDAEVQTPTAALSYSTPQAPTDTAPTMSAPTPQATQAAQATPATPAPAAPVSPAAILQPVASTSTTTTTIATVETRPTGVSPAAGTTSTTSARQAGPLATVRGGPASSTVGGATSTVGTNAPPTAQPFAASPGGAQTSPSGSLSTTGSAIAGGSAAGGSTSAAGSTNAGGSTSAAGSTNAAGSTTPPNATQPTTLDTGPPTANSSGGSSAPQQ
jgi:RNA polymerase sigma factor (sigma-70 family)